MIFNPQTKALQTRSDKPNENWTDDDTWTVIDDNSELAEKILNTYPYFECVFDGDILVDITATEIPPKPIEQVRAALKQEVGKACTAAIYAGVEVGGNRYSLTEHDQTEIMAQLQTVREGAFSVPYHADGELCRMYAATEFSEIAKAAAAHIFYHRTYCNHLNAWIKRAEHQETIFYGAELPQDLADSMAALLAAAGGVM